MLIIAIPRRKATIAVNIGVDRGSSGKIGWQHDSTVDGYR
jgi:hypothetical protein